LNREVEKVSTGNHMNDTQLKVFLFMKIWKPDKGEVNAWTSFTSKYDEDGVLHGTSLEDFQQHMKNHWTQHGSPGDISDVSKTALNVNHNPRMVPTCEVCNRKGHTGEKCWKDERNANQRPIWWKTFDKDGEFTGKCFQCGETGHKGFQCKKKPYGETALMVVEEKSETEDVVMLVTEEKSRDFNYNDGWMKNPEKWYEIKEQRGFDACHGENDVKGQEEEKGEMTEGVKQNDTLGKRFLDETMSEEQDDFENQVAGIFGMQDDGKTLVWKNKHEADVTWECEDV
jgi:hypothetical protein